MNRLKSARGGVNVGGLLTLLIIAFLIYELFQFGPVLIAQYEFKDAVVEEAKFSRGKNAYAIKKELTQKAADLGLPIVTDQIAVTLQPTKTRIQVQYELSVEWLPGREYTWQVDEVAESVLY